MKSNGLNIEKTGKPARIGAANKKPSKVEDPKGFIGADGRRYFTHDEIWGWVHAKIREYYGISESGDIV